MAVNLSPVGGVAGQFFDNNGNPLTGGKLYTYAAGTTTPQATYTSAAGVIAHSNPIILNAGGRVPNEIWLTDGLEYKFALYDANNVLIGTWDDIIGINSNFVNFVSSEEVQIATAGQTVFTLTTMQYQPGTNNLVVYVDGVNQVEGGSYSYVETNPTTVTFTAGLHVGAVVKFVSAESLSTNVINASTVVYDPPGVSAVTTTAQTKLRQTISVKDFGAVGDGVADDTAAIQAAVDYAATLTNGCGILCDGTFKTTSTITISGEGVFLFASSPNAGRFTRSTDFGPTLHFTDGSTQLGYVGFQNLYFVNTGTMTATSGAAVVMDMCYGAVVKDSYIVNCFAGLELRGVDNGYVDGLNVSANTGAPTGRYAVKIGYSTNGTRIGGDLFFSNCNFWCGTKAPGAGVTITPYMDYGIKVEGVDGLWLSNVHVISTKIANYSIGTTSGYAIGNIYATQAMADICEGNGIELVGTSGVSYMTWSGRISGLGQTDAGKAGISITSPCAELRFDVSIDEFDGDGVYINNAGAYNIDFVAPNIFANNYDAVGTGSGFNIVHGNGITITGGHIRGGSKQSWGVLLGANASEVTINGVRIEDHVSGGIKLTAGCAYVDILNCDLRNNTNLGGVIIDNPGGITGLLIENCGGYTPIANTKSWTPGLINNGGQAFTSVTVFGAELGDFASVSSSIDTAGVNLNAYVSATNTVIVNAINNTGSGVTLGALTLYVKVDKKS